MISSADEAQVRTRDGFTDGSHTAGTESTSAAHGAASADNPLEPLLQQVAAIRESAVHYLEAQKDSTEAAIRRLMIKAIVGVVAAIICATALITCTVMLTGALSDLMSIAAGGRPWVGKLVVGGGLLIATAITVRVYISRWMRSARAQTVRKYESRHHAQR